MPAWHLFRFPESVEFEAAGALMQQGMTAHYLSHDVFPLGPEHTALIHAAAGGTGLMLVQMARLCGARVIGVVSSRTKAGAGRTGRAQIRSS